MSDIMDNETLKMYADESREHLEDIESDLLEIERLEANIDEDLVNKVFRAAHSIKGGGGFLGLDNIKELAHKIENVLDLIRSYQMVPASEVVNTLLRAFDRLGELLDNAEESNEIEINDHVVALEGLTSSNLGEDEKATIHQETEIVPPSKLTRFTVTEFDIIQVIRGGKNLYVLEYDLINDVHRQSKTPLDILHLLDDGGQVLDITVELASVGNLDSETVNTSIPMFVLYASIVEDDLIGTLLGLDNSKIEMIPRESLGDDETAEARATTTAEPIAPEVTAEEDLAEESAEEIQPVPPPTSTRKAPETKTKTISKSDSLRVNVQILDQLMNRAGELVLARNQLLQSISVMDKQSISAAGQRVDLVTSELQEIIMLTRMQPVSNIFNKFPRVVRDIAQQLSKRMVLELEGSEVELDKTIIEGLGDPLTHLVRNSADHGIELPDARKKKGKKPKGRIVLRAFHESGQVIIEIEDDGKGLDPNMLTSKALKKKLITPEQAESMTDSDKINLIMLPGFSTADQVTEVSGRGVGMDVVKTNLDEMGGQVEIHSEVDKGTTIRIKLPLTLAIIPSLLVTSCDERFALPQVNVGELLQVSAAEIREKIERIGGAEVLVLRGELIPLLHLKDVLNIEAMFFDKKTGQYRPDRRAGLVDERTLLADEDEAAPTGEQDGGQAAAEETLTAAELLKADERRLSRGSDVNIAVVQAGSFKYGLVVDKLHDTVEIVVKPLGRHFKGNEVFAGATIMGDGHVALILDVPGLAQAAELKSISESERVARQKKDEKTAAKDGSTRQTLLLFRNGPQEQCGVPLELVLRVEQITQGDIEIKGGKKVIQYRGGSLPIYALEEAANVEMLEETEKLNIIIFMIAGREVGLLAVAPLDILETEMTVDETTLRQPGINGSAIIRGQTTLLLDIFGLMETINPDWFDTGGEAFASTTTEEGGHSGAILLAEDSNFFRTQVKEFVESAGYSIIEAEDGQEAWNYLDANPEDVALLLTDIEMPVMDGFELTQKVKADERFSNIPVVALTSLAGDEDVARGKEVGIDDYQIKIDKEKLLATIAKHLKP